MSSNPIEPRRSALYLPASNARALEKSRSLPADVLIFDLEDAVAPQARAQARENLVAAFAQGGFGNRTLVIRVNEPDSADFALDAQAAMQCAPRAILLPKVSDPTDIGRACLGLLQARPESTHRPALWAMIETPKSVLHLAAIARAGVTAPLPLECLVVGTNDLSKETGVAAHNQRQFLLPWLMHIVLVARCEGLTVLDGVWNDFRDTAGFEAELAQSRAMGFDGKTLIHPTQIDAANTVFAPSAAELEEARAIVAAFARPENAAAGVINLNGRMVERLHRDMALRMLRLADAIHPAGAAGAEAPGAGR